MSLIVKKAILALLSKESRKKVGRVILIILSPFLIVASVFNMAGDAVTSHNNAVVNTIFNPNASIPSSVPLEFREYILSFREAMLELDNEILLTQSRLYDGTLDELQIKVLFFVSYYHENSVSFTTEFYKEFVDAFIKSETVIEERFMLVAVPNEFGGYDESLVPYYVEVEVTYPIDDFVIIKNNVYSVIGRSFDGDELNNYQSILQIINFGATASTAGQGSTLGTNLSEYFTASIGTEFVGDGWVSPFDFDWRSIVTSEYGHRPNPTGPGYEYHSGIDFGAPIGTSINAIANGTVRYIRNHENAYGYHLAIDHGNNIFTVYAHCSRIIVREGQSVNAGQKIAEVGNTGRSTGPHLHLEVWKNSSRVNPREVLP